MGALQRRCAICVYERCSSGASTLGKSSCQSYSMQLHRRRAHGRALCRVFGVLRCCCAVVFGKCPSLAAPLGIQGNAQRASTGLHRHHSAARSAVEWLPMGPAAWAPAALWVLIMAGGKGPCSAGAFCGTQLLLGKRIPLQLIREEAATALPRLLEPQHRAGALFMRGAFSVHSCSCYPRIAWCILLIPCFQCWTLGRQCGLPRCSVSVLLSGLPGWSEHACPLNSRRAMAATVTSPCGIRYLWHQFCSVLQKYLAAAHVLDVRFPSYLRPCRKPWETPVVVHVFAPQSRA